VRDNFRYELSPNLKIIETHREPGTNTMCTFVNEVRYFCGRM